MEGDFERTNYESISLLGRTLSLTVNLESAMCGCNAAWCRRPSAATKSERKEEEADRCDAHIMRVNRRMSVGVGTWFLWRRTRIPAHVAATTVRTHKRRPTHT